MCVTAAPDVCAGAAVSGQYADAREDARDHARLRNQYFQQVSSTTVTVTVTTVLLLQYSSNSCIDYAISMLTQTCIMLL